MAALSKEEYLKRYLSNSDSGSKKKRKKKLKAGIKPGNSLLIDDDVNLRDIAVKHEDESENNMLELAEENPLIFDEAGTTVLSKDLEFIKKKEEARKAMWAPVRNAGEEDSLKTTEQSSDSSKVKDAFRSSPSSSMAKDLSLVRRVEREPSGGVSFQRRERHNSPSPERAESDLSLHRHGRTGSPGNLRNSGRHGGAKRHIPDDQSLHARKIQQNSEDMSPPGRRRRHDSSDISPPRQGRRGDSADISPLRRGVRHDSSDMSPLRRGRRHDSSDVSPPRRQVRDGSHDISPPRQRPSHDSPDISPPRRRPRHDFPDISPPTRRPRHDSPDISPPRRRPRHDSPDISPPRHCRQDSSSDQSPPRRKHTSPLGQKSSKLQSPGTSWNNYSLYKQENESSNRQNSRIHDMSDEKELGHVRKDCSSDQSPPRRQNSDCRSMKRGPRHDSPDLSPPRSTNSRARSGRPLSRHHEFRHNKESRKKARHDTPDQSPVRQTKMKDEGSTDFFKRKRNTQSPKLSPPRDPKNERKAGLHSATELKRENELAKRREEEMFSRMSTSASGRGAETVHRDKTGRKRDLDVEKANKKEEERKKLEEDEKFMEWGKGLQQTKKAKEKVDDVVYEMSKPLARYKDDEDLDQMLRERDRSGDPMLAFMQKKKAKQDVRAGKKEKPQYKGPAPPPNRFNIQPGYRWDGVDRSNGFEKKRFTMLANKGATREEAYKWSTEDM